MTTGEAAERRRVWERRWATKDGRSFEWHQEDVPAQLAEVVDSADHPVGVAVDLGCGAGVATAFLARSQPFVVGLDVALGAVLEARQRLEPATAAAFVVGDAAMLPFRGDSVGLVFDRGCLQNLAEPEWPAYFAETSRVLQVGGVAQVLCSRTVAPPLLSLAGLRKRAKRLLGRGGRGSGPQFLSHALLRALASGRFRVERIEDFPFELATGQRRVFTHCLLRRPPAPT